MLEASEPIETLNFHNQIDGETNNVYFKTLSSRIEVWQNSKKSFFGNEKTPTIKNGTEVKITCDIEADKNCLNKVKFYKTGSVVIQGAKCTHVSNTSLCMPMPSSVNQISLVHNHYKAGNKCYNQDNTDTLKTQVCEHVPRKSKLHLLWPRTRRGIKS